MGGGLMYAFTSSWVTTSLFSDLYGKCSLWITPHTVVEEEGRVKVTLPSLKHISSGHISDTSATPVRVADTTLSSWFGEYLRTLHICLHGTVFAATNSYSNFDDTTLQYTVTIAGKEVVAVAAGEVDKVGDFTLKMEDSDMRYSLLDIEKALQILPVVTNVWIFLEHLPKNMGVEQWKTAVDSAAKMETIFLRGEGKVDEGWEADMGRLIKRAKKAEMRYIKFSNSFVEGVLQGLGEEGAICEKMEFSYRSSSDNEEMMKMMEKLGWEKLGWDNTDYGDSLVCVKK